MFLSLRASGSHNNHINILLLPTNGTPLLPRQIQSTNNPIQTTTCTFYEPLPTATYPAFCAPSDQVNVVAPASHSGYQVVPNFSAPSKMDCCAACASVFNCVWWKFDFGTSGDGWAPGICHYAYYTGNNQNTDGNQPAICPNGATLGIPFGANPPADREESNNQPGCNFGPCGNAYDVFQSSQDFGYPDDYYFHQCSP
jgi:hypothetical protein